eukprot:gene41921-51965_t
MNTIVDKRLFAVPLLCLLLAGCADNGGIKPQASLQQANTLDAGNAIRQIGNEAGWPKRAWWENYGDAQLNALVLAAVSNNPSMAIAAAR